jgi:tetratricopeptide (TPR) repeat protein
MIVRLGGTNLRQLLATLLCALVALGPAHAFAQDSGGESAPLTKAQEERVLQLIDAGKAAYNRGEFDNALESFRAAHELFPHPDIVYRMALCYERLGEDVQAVKYYKQFLTEVPDAPERPRIEKTIQVIEARIAKSEIRVVTDPEGAVVYIDDIANGAAGYTPTELPVRPGNYRVIVKKEGYDTVEELVEVSSGQTVALRYQLKSVDGSSKLSGPGTSTGAQPQAGRPFDPTWVILLSVGVASFVASALFYQPYKQAADNVSKFEDDLQNVSREIYEEEKSSRNLYLGLTIGSAAVGFGLLVWSFIEYQSSKSFALRDASEGEDESFVFGFGPTSDGRGAAFDLGFSW